MTEVFATFDYKTQEEVLIVVKTLISILSTSGMQLMDTLCPSALLEPLRGRPAASGLQDVPSSDAIMIDPQQQSLDVAANDRLNSVPTYQLAAPWELVYLPIMRRSFILAVLVLLKGDLKNIYGLTEEYVLSSSSSVLWRKTQIHFQGGVVAL